jgi:hypothetical protein
MVLTRISRGWGAIRGAVISAFAKRFHHAGGAGTRPAPTRLVLPHLRRGNHEGCPIDIKLSPPIPVSAEKSQDTPDASPHDKSPYTPQTTPTTPLNPNHNANTPPTPQTTSETHAPPCANSYPIRPHATPTTASATAPQPSTSHTTRTTHATHADCDTRPPENNSSTPETKSPPANAHAPNTPTSCADNTASGTFVINTSHCVNATRLRRLDTLLARILSQPPTRTVHARLRQPKRHHPHRHTRLRSQHTRHSLTVSTCDNHPSKSNGSPVSVNTAVPTL